MRVIKLSEGEREEWMVATDDYEPYLHVDVAHRDGEVIAIAIKLPPWRIILTRSEIKALTEVLRNYEI